MSRSSLLALLVVAVLVPGCGSSSRIDGREWRPVNTIAEPVGTTQPIGVRFHLPGNPEVGLDERVDPDRFLIIGVAYEGCHWSDPRFVGIGPGTLELRLTELLRECVRPIPMTAWFAIPWDELPTALVVVDQLGERHQIMDRRLDR